MKLLILRQWTAFRKEVGVRHWLDETRKSEDRYEGYHLLRQQVHQVAGRDADPLLLSAVDEQARHTAAASFVLFVLAMLFGILAAYGIVADTLYDTPAALLTATAMIALAGVSFYVLLTSIRGLALPRILARDSFVNDLFKFPDQPSASDDDAGAGDDDEDDEQ